MPNDLLGLLGLAKRAGKLAVGDEPVRELIALGKARCVFLASDAGAGISKKLHNQSAQTSFILLELAENKEALGQALGRACCAVCATADAGFAASAAKKIARDNPTAQAAAEVLGQKQDRILQRRSKPKKKGVTLEYVDIEEDEYQRRFGKQAKDTGKIGKPHE